MAQQSSPEKCENCSGRGYDIIGLKGAGSKTYRRLCHVCEGSGQHKGPAMSAGDTPLTDAVAASAVRVMNDMTGSKRRLSFYDLGAECVGPLTEHARRMERDRAALMEALERFVKIHSGGSQGAYLTTSLGQAAKDARALLARIRGGGA